MFSALPKIDGAWVYGHVVLSFNDGERGEKVERNGKRFAEVGRDVLRDEDWDREVSGDASEELAENFGATCAYTDRNRADAIACDIWDLIGEWGIDPVASQVGE